MKGSGKAGLHLAHLSPAWGDQPPPLALKPSPWSVPHTPLSCPRGEGTEGARLSEIYAKLEEIEADKAPAR